MAAEPDLDVQTSFWDDWNISHRVGEVGSFMARQLAEAQRAAAALTGNGHAGILEVGCGTGWLAGSLTRYGDVTATDLSELSIAVGRARHPDVRFIAGDFAVVDVGGPFDLVVSADTIAHVADQQYFVNRIASLLRPGGTLLLMTQNGFVWRRWSYLSPQGEGQLRNWPSLRRLREMLQSSFAITAVRTIEPAGDRGVLVLPGAMRYASRKLGLREPVYRLQERMRIGRELVVVARRRTDA